MNAPVSDLDLIEPSDSPGCAASSLGAARRWRFEWVSSFGSDFNDDFLLPTARPGAKGRDEEALLRGEGEWWWRRHDEYGKT